MVGASLRLLPNPRNAQSSNERVPAAHLLHGPVEEAVTQTSRVSPPLPLTHRQSLFGLMVTSSAVNTTSEELCEPLWDLQSSKSVRAYVGFAVGIPCVAFAFLGSIYLMM